MAVNAQYYSIKSLSSIFVRINVEYSVLRVFRYLPFLARQNMKVAKNDTAANANAKRSKSNHTGRVIHHHEHDNTPVSLSVSRM